MPVTEALHAQWPGRRDWPRLDGVELDGEDGAARLTLAVPEDSPWLDGHFPDRAVLPGVVQLRWAIDASRLVWPGLTTVTAVANLKFRAPILPPAVMVLSLALDETGKRLQFTFHQDGNVRSTGRVTFE